ncbi:unnamed protein product, partial [Polarella glacialis]
MSSTALKRAVLHPAWDCRIRFSDLEYKPTSLRIGDLAGNHFSLVLRGVPASLSAPEGRQQIQLATESLKNEGFLNFFGLQRFGSQRIASHLIGAALLASDWDGALKLILGDAAADLLPLAMKIAAGGNGGLDALPRLPQSHHLERELLGGVADGLSAEAALRRLPFSVLFMYVNAAQSLVFNSVLSHRVRHFGSQPVQGDLAAPSSAASASGAAAAAADGVFGLAWGALGAPTLSSRAAASLGPQGLASTVLPLPGRSIRYPPHLKAAYEEASQELLSIPLAAFHAAAGITPPEGAYRAAAVRPESVESHFLAPEEVVRLGKGILLSDVDSLYQAGSSTGAQSSADSSFVSAPIAGSSAKHNKNSNNSNNDNNNNKNNSINNQHSQRRPPNTATEEAALVLKFSLAPAAYATMAVRELSRGLADVIQADAQTE